MPTIDGRTGQEPKAPELEAETLSCGNIARNELRDQATRTSASIPLPVWPASHEIFGRRAPLWHPIPNIC